MAATRPHADTGGGGRGARTHPLTTAGAVQAHAASAAIRCTAKLLCTPTRVWPLLRFPLLRWHYIYTQPCLSRVLTHLPDIVWECVKAAATEAPTYREITVIVNRIAAHSPPPLRRPPRAAATSALAVITAHCAAESSPPDCESPTVLPAPIIDTAGPVDAPPHCH